jgi:dipeptidyl aminopeptidase/acylaminoacyl peptidase
VRPVIVVAGALLAQTAAAKSAPAGLAMSSADAVATTRFMPAGPGSDQPISLSPDGRRYVVRLVRGDVERNGIWVDVLAGSLDSLDAAAPTRVAHLFSTGRGMADSYGGPSADGFATYSPIRWISDHTVAFLFSNRHEVRQVVTVDVKTRQAVFETKHRNQTHAFEVAPNGTLVYLANLERPPLKPSMPSNGLVVPERIDARSVAQGFFDGSTEDSRFADAVWFVKQRGQEEKRITIPGPSDGGFPTLQHLTLSQDGRHAILSAPASGVPADWEQYAGQTRAFPAPSFNEDFHYAHADRQGIEARKIMQLYLLDVGRAVATPLWNAPALLSSWMSSWSPDGDKVILTPIPIPIAEQHDTSTELQTVLFDISNGRHWIIPAEGTVYPTGNSAIRKITWNNNHAFELEQQTSQETRRACFAYVGDRWQPQVPCETLRAETPRTKPRKIHVEVRENLNTPPRLFAVNEDDRSERLLLDPNPELTSKFKLGRVEYLQGSLTTGEHWSALLTLPANYQEGKKYPLVMEYMSTGGPTLAADKFTLYGWPPDGRLGPSLIAPYTGQILAGRGIAVVAIAVNVGTSNPEDGPKEAETKQRAFEELAGRLVAENIADERRIGVCGFSRSGYIAYHAISHSRLPFAAAVVADNVDYSYVQTVLGNNYAAAEAAIGAPAYGGGLKTWLARATGFNVDSIRAPLLLIGQSGGARSNVLGQWEILSQLRWMKRPVEMYLMPEIDTHPSHNMQNPRQVIAVQERTVDWFDFWLNSHEMPDAAKSEQYKRWRAFRRLAIDENQAATPAP